MLNSFNEYQRVLVLGGKSEIALGILRTINVSEDAQLMLMGRDISRSDVPSELRNSSVSFHNVNFLEIEKSTSLIEALFDKGDIDLCVIAYAVLGDTESQLEDSNFFSTLNTNFTSQAVLLNYVSKRMRMQKHGQILQISSVAGIRPQKYNFVYGASKAGVDFIAQGLQKICEPENVFITILRPGFVRTKLSKGAPSAPFETNVDFVARSASRALRLRKKVAYSPPILAPIMLMIKIIPNSLMVRLEAFRD
jgi:decaprenylphospho-beta-D-erythro-pentofuranosid-2-ulose 2-reductase